MLGCMHVKRDVVVHSGHQIQFCSTLSGKVIPFVALSRHQSSVISPSCMSKSSLMFFVVMGCPLTACRPQDLFTLTASVHRISAEGHCPDTCGPATSCRGRVSWHVVASCRGRVSWHVVAEPGPTLSHPLAESYRNLF